jgi:cobalt-zinc-cadmium efflux system membrane fusion protein
MMMKTKILVSAIALISLISCNNATVNNDAEEHKEEGREAFVLLNADQRKALNLNLGTFEMRNLTTVIKTNGQLEVAPDSRAEVSVPIGGNVKSIKVFMGDKVNKGQILALLEHPDYIELQENFAEVANRLEYLEKDYERQKELYEKNVGSGKSYQQSKADYNIAKSKYEGLKARLKLLNISPGKVMEGGISPVVNVVSPIKGFVNRINIKVGTYVDAGDKMFEITDNSAIHADFLVYEKDVSMIKEGQKIHFTIASLPGKEFTSTIFAIGKEFEKNTRAVHIHSRLDNYDPALIPGMYISGHIHTNKHLTRTLPNDAIVTEGTKSFIFVLDNSALNNDEDHNHDHEHKDIMAFRMVEVIPGSKDDGYTEIKLINDLPEDSKIVLNAAYYLLADMNKEETEHEH